MSIAGKGHQGKEGMLEGYVAPQDSFFSRIPREVLVILIILLSSTASFGFGILAGRSMGAEEGQGIRVEYATSTQSGVPSSSQAASAAAAVFAPSATSKNVEKPISTPPPVQGGEGMYVASKNGKRYYLPWCGGVKNIKEENKVWFSSKEEAEAKGYTPAANCKGI